MDDLVAEAGQTIIDDINKTKNREENYKIAYNQIVDTESGINQLKNVLKNFTSCSDYFSKFIKDFSESLQKIYKDTPYHGYIDTIINCQETILNEIDLLNKSIVKIYSRTSEWNTIFQQAKEKKKIRDEKKKKYEHYLEKLEKIDKKEKKKKNHELVERNSLKYQTAAKEYIEIAESSYDIFNNSLKLGWELINPIVSDFILQVKLTAYNVYSNLNDFSNIKDSFEEIKQAKNESNNYDPKKYIQDRKLVRCDKKRGMVNSSLKIWGMKKEVSKEQNFIIVERKTNTFGPVSDEIRQIFWEIKDEPY